MSMDQEELQQKINKAKVTPEGSRLIPYPHQDSGEWYPEYDTYGELWESAQHDNSAKDHVESYNWFVSKLKKFIERAK